MEDNTTTYATKPEQKVEEKQSSISRSIISLLLFIAAFYFFFDRDLKFVLILVVILFIHELGHFIAMKVFNYSDVKMFFVPLVGALVTGKKKEVSQTQRAIIILAGPIPGIIIGLALLIFIALGNHHPDLMMIANIFILLNIFNLLPVSPLDGGNLIETLFFNSKEKIQIIFTILSLISLIIIALYSQSYFLLIIPFFLFIRLNNQLKTKNIKGALDLKNIHYNQPIEEMSDEEYWLIRKEIIFNFGVFKNIDPNQQEESNNETQIMNIMSSLSSQKMSNDMSMPVKFIFTGLWILFFIAPILLFFIYTQN